MTEAATESVDLELETATGTEQETQETTEELEAEPTDPGAEETEEEGEGEGNAEETEIEFSTIEIDGKEYQVPKELEGAFLKNKDYTQKSQANAERTRALEAKEAEIEERAKATEEELDMRATLRSVDAQIAEYAKLTKADWDAHQLQDPMGTEQHWRAFQMLKDQKAELSEQLSTKQNERTQAAQQDLAKRVEQTNAFAKENIKGWNPQLTDTLVKYAVDTGIPESVLKQQWSPTLYKLLHRAWVGERALSKQIAALPKPQTTNVKPSVTVTGKSNPGAKKSLADMDMDEYVAARKSGRVR